jgi:hypothetical protein
LLTLVQQGAGVWLQQDAFLQADSGQLDAGWWGKGQQLLLAGS